MVFDLGGIVEKSYQKQQVQKKEKEGKEHIGKGGDVYGSGSSNLLHIMYNSGISLGFGSNSLERSVWSDKNF